MSDAFVGLRTDGTGKKVDADAVTTASGTVHRQRVVNSDPVDANSHARVKAIASADGTELGLVVSAKAFLDQLVALAGLDTKLASILTALGLRATETTLGSVLTTLGVSDARQAAILTALGPLATQATLSTRASETTLASVLTALGLTSTEATLAALLARFPAVAALADGALGSVSKIASAGLGWDGTNYQRIRTDLAGVASNAIATLAGAQQVLPLLRHLDAANLPALISGYSTMMRATSNGAMVVRDDSLIGGEDPVNGVMHVHGAAVAGIAGSWTAYFSGATKVGAAGIAVHAVAGRLRFMYAVNTHATVGYWLLPLNKASAGVANDLTHGRPLWLPANSAPPVEVLDFGEAGLYCSLGKAYAISTTPEKVTLPATSDCFVWVHYT